MIKNNESIRYELPGHRIKILGAIIFGLLVFLTFTISKLDQAISLSDFLLIPAIIMFGLWFKRFLKRYSNVGFLINDTGLFNLDETIVCKMSDIARVDVSPYTFKSANGFIVLLKTQSSFKSIPGLYWRLGKRISIGGLVSKNESKFLSGALLRFLEKK